MSVCEHEPIIWFINNGILPIFQYVIPFVLILLCVIHFFKKDKKKNKSYFIIRIVIALIVFFVILTLRFGIRKTINSCQENYWEYWEKPIMYIYPSEKIDLEVKLVNEEKLLYTYPKYKNIWDITVYQDGTIYDKKTKKNYYSLYWEGTNNTSEKFADGFVIEGKNTTKFLEEKLSYLGLNDREINEFIIYWLPQMESNKYNLIRFKTMEEINKIMPLDFSIQPDTLIRVFMSFKPINEKINITEQKLEKVERKGFIVVEWGGSKVE